MTLPEPVDVIAPRDDEDPYETAEAIGEMMAGAYAYGDTVEYRGFTLLNDGDLPGFNIWRVFNEDGAFIEVLNLEAFQSATEIEAVLDDLVAHDPADRGEWTPQAP